MSPLVIDYIWYTTSSLSVTSLLGDVDPGYLTKVVGFPNVHFPSECVAVSLSLIVFN
jgi:CCR4-NOT transcription complex subunit 6